jgi:hypothetical protein
LTVKQTNSTMDKDTQMDTKDEKRASVDYAVGEMESDRALLRRIDWRILPIMFLTYFLQFLDKVSLNAGSPLYCYQGDPLLTAAVVCEYYGSTERPGHGRE